MPVVRTFLRLTLLALVMALLSLGASHDSSSSPVVSPSIEPVATTSPLQKVRRQILADTNEYRLAAGLKPLRLKKGASIVAQGWSKKMAAKSVMAHNPNYAAQMPKGWTRVGENVAYGYSSKSVTEAWFKSPGHKANLLGDYTHIGIGWKRDSNGTPYYTQNFGKY